MTEKKKTVDLDRKSVKILESANEEVLDILDSIDEKLEMLIMLIASSKDNPAQKDVYSMVADVARRFVENYRQR